MKTRFVALAGAVALGLAAPALPQTIAPPPAAELAAGQIALRISAQGAAQADFATIELSLSGSGANEAEAEAALHEAERFAMDNLERICIGGTHVAVSPPKLTQTEEYDWESAAVEAAAAAVEEAAGDLGGEEALAVEYPFDEELPIVTRWAASSTMTVTVEELAMLPDVISAVNSGEVPVLSTVRPKFHFRDEARSDREAIGAALAKARIDADAHADALGYRVVRIVAVSNEGPRFSLPALLQAMATIDNPSRDWTVAGQRIATVSVDFVIAPK